jgi:hypothetical protein
MTKWEILDMGERFGLTSDESPSDLFQWFVADDWVDIRDDGVCVFEVELIGFFDTVVIDTDDLPLPEYDVETQLQKANDCLTRLYGDWCSPDGVTGKFRMVETTERECE